MIETKDVTVVLSKKQIVKHASLEVNEGEFVGIIGPNGSGKSTLLKTIYRVLKTYEGDIIINNANIRDVTLQESALNSAVVAQHNFYNFDFTVIDVVLMGRSPHKKPMERDNNEDREIAMDALEKVDMVDFKDRSFHTLSGGEQQRIILARALAQRTACLILDEPTNHLDIRYQLQLLDVVKRLKSTVLCALHDLNLAAIYCDRLYLMKEGEIYLTGTPDEILTVEIIREVYGVEVCITKDPEHGLLNIVYCPDHVRRY